jgi:hypothetical protein
VGYFEHRSLLSEPSWDEIGRIYGIGFRRQGRSSGSELQQLNSCH